MRAWCPFGFRGFNAAASLKRFGEGEGALHGAPASAVLMPRPH